LAFDDIATPQSSQLDVYIRQVDVADGPTPELGVLEHHLRIHVADRVRESVKIRESLGLQG
jgi:hypothetical protein